MPVNPNIALSFKPFQAEPQNALADYAAIAKIQEAQQAQQLNALKMQEAQQSLEQHRGLTNWLRGGGDISTPEGRVQAQQYGAPGLALIKEQRAAESSAATAAKERHALLGQIHRDLAANPTDENILAGISYIRDSKLFPEVEVARVTAIGKSLLGMPIEQRTGILSQQGATAGELKEKVVAPTELQKLMAARDALPAGDPKRATFDAAISKLTTHAPAPSASVKVNTFTPASEEAQKDFMKAASATRDALKNAGTTLDNLEKARELIPSAKGFMGPGGESLLKAASFLNSRLGTSINVKGVSDATELRSRLFQGVIDNLRKVDAQPTEAQQTILQDALGRIGTDPNALSQVLDFQEQMIRSRVSAFNDEVTEAEKRGVKFPYRPQITLPQSKRASAARATTPATPSKSADQGWKDL